jgi:hypothetical protein
MTKTGLGEDETNLNNNIRTFITFNKGGKWEPIKPPSVDSENKKIKCDMEDGCSLHL